MATTRPAATPTNVGPYHLLRPLGQGGMATVFAAIHERMEREVALKILSAAAAAAPQLAARFVQEARALARIEHPGVVRVITADTLADGTTYLVMERLDGPSLRAWMEQRPGPIAPAAALPIARQIADAMVAVHAEGIVHRDLKPDNVVITSMASGSQRATIIDFGIAKVPPVTGELPFDTRVQTVTAAFMGTFTYIAPEQCRNAAAVTDRADVYALGVILFEMLAGCAPFVAAEPIEVLSMHVKDDPPALQDRAPAVPARLAAFVASMLAKDPAARPTMRRCRDVLQRPWEDERDACPVPGISPFTEAHAELFFGRAAEADQLLSALAEARAGSLRWVQLEGPGGIGKTSLVQAAVLPRLTIASAPDTTGWIIANLRPTDAPLQALARALSSALRPRLDRPLGDLESLLRRGPAALGSLVADHTPPGACVLLVIDQVEELFTLGAAHREEIDALLATALETPGCPLRLLTTLRTDFLLALERMPGLARLLGQAARQKLGPMEAGLLTAAVQTMAQRAGIRLSEGLAERMVRDAAGEGSRLPLLGHALSRLWSLSRGAPLTHERYEQLGGVSGALAQQANLLLDSLGNDGRERARWILLNLVQLGRGVADTCRPRTREQVIAAAGGDGLAEEVLLRLSGMHADGPGGEHGSRLLVLSREVEPSLQRVDLIHETLLREVPCIAGWIEQERPLLERHADLEAAAGVWEQAGCPAEGLPSGSLLRHYRGLDGDARRALILDRVSSARARRFLGAAQTLERRRRRIWQGALAMFVVTAAAITGSALYAWRERQRAEANLQQVVKGAEQVVSDADWDLGRMLYTLEVRRRMLDQIEESLRTIRTQERDTPEVDLALIRTWQRRSDLARTNETLARAEDLLRAAEGLIHTVLDRQPGDRELKKRLALNESKRGKVALAQGRLEEAHAAFARSIVLLEQLPPGEGEGAEDDRRTLAISHSEEADVEMEAGHAVAAAQRYDRAITLLQQNHDALDNSLGALMLASRGDAARLAGDSVAARRFLDQALAVQAALCESSPGNALYRWILARIHLASAQLRGACGDREGAALALDAALDLGRALVEGEPTNKSYALTWCESLVEEEVGARARGDEARAVRSYGNRCRLAAAFMRADSADVRFQRFACPGENH